MGSFFTNHTKVCILLCILIHNQYFIHLFFFSLAVNCHLECLISYTKYLEIFSSRKACWYFFLSCTSLIMHHWVFYHFLSLLLMTPLPYPQLSRSLVVKSYIPWHFHLNLIHLRFPKIKKYIKSRNYLENKNLLLPYFQTILSDSPKS